jgi:hypothetical protein
MPASYTNFKYARILVLMQTMIHVTLRTMHMILGNTELT